MRGWRAVVELARGTVRQSWRDRVLGLAAEAGFWQLMSLAPLLLGVLGLIGYFADNLGPDTLDRIERAVIDGAGKLIVPSAVDTLVRPTLHKVLTSGRADVVSIGFVISLWTGSTAMATYVNTITIAYGLRHQRSAVHSRLLALWLYLGAVVVGVVVLPLVVLGPTLLVRLAPKNAHDVVHTIVTIGYWPVVILLVVSLLATLYHLAVPVRTPWRRDLPGAVLAMVLWLLGSYVLRSWLLVAFRESSTYGPVSSPIAVLLFFYITALSILFGAELNAEIDRLWPRPETAEARRHEGTARPADLAQDEGGEVDQGASWWLPGAEE